MYSNNKKRLIIIIICSIVFVIAVKFIIPYGKSVSKKMNQDLDDSIKKNQAAPGLVPDNSSEDSGPGSVPKGPGLVPKN